MILNATKSNKIATGGCLLAPDFSAMMFLLEQDKN
jgi:hypothetical protein